ncbi:Pro-Pol polyprotein [Trichinella pseudospiralis]
MPSEEPGAQNSKLKFKNQLKEEFPEELESLKQESKLRKSCRLWPLNPYINDDGILRVMKLLVRGQHIRHLNAGVDQILSCLRQRYWIVNGRSIIKQVIRECVAFRKENAKPFLAKMSDLLRKRVVKVFPYENTGLDLVGPLYAREGNSVKKVYICLFTAITSSPRAIHLELVFNLTTQRALDRFFARQGQLRIIHPV